jgi:hypothetical protein
VLDPVSQQNVDLVDERGAPRGQKLLVSSFTLPKSALLDTMPEIKNQGRVALDSSLLLLGYDLPGDSLQPGKPVKVSLWLQLAGRPSADLAILFRLQEAFNATAWQTSARVLPGYPPAKWEANEINRVIYTLLLPPELSDGNYSLQISTGQAWTTLRTLQIVAREHVYERPAMQHVLDLQFEHGITLLGYDVEAHKASEMLPATIRLYWRALEPVSASYKVSVQALSAGTNIAAQSDTIPVGWTYPTTAWLPGEIVTDEHFLSADHGLEAGDYALIVVLYEEQDGTRLGVAQAGVAADHAALSTLHIIP